MANLEQSMADKITEWRAGLKSAFGLDVDPAAPQAQLTSRGGNLVLLTPSVMDGALYFSMVYEQVPDIEARVLRYLLARNLFMSDTSGGWLAFEPQEGRICYQFRWDGFLFANFVAFLSILTVFTERADDIGQEIRDFRASTEAGGETASQAWASSGDFVVKL